MKHCALIGSADKIREVYGTALLSAMAARGMDTTAVLTKALLQAQPDAAATVQYLFSTWGMPEFTAEEVRRYFPALRAVFYAAGSVQGFAPAFLENGIKVFSAWAANAVPVAEYTVAQIVLANKGYFSSARLYKQAKSQDSARAYAFAFPGNYNACVGIIGAGMIGKMVIERLKAYRLQTLVFDPFLPDAAAERLGVEKCGLAELFRRCDTISNHLANNPQTVGMLNYALFSQMKPRATFLNTGRGAQVVEADLARALTEQPGRTAVLDVTWPEPPAPDSPFYTLPNVILTPHIAGSFGNELVRMAEYMLEEYAAFTGGQATRYEVTAEMLKTMA